MSYSPLGLMESQSVYFHPHIQFSNPGWTQCLLPFKVLSTNIPSLLALGPFNEHFSIS